MANHGYVKTRKKMTATNVHALLVELNNTVFKGVFSLSCDDTFWRLVYKQSNPSVETLWLAERACWLKTSRTFEIKHSGGPKFIDWADCVILDCIARKFGGIISDDGVSEKWQPREESYTLAEYLQLVYREGVPAFELDFIPWEFHDDLSALRYIDFSCSDDGRIVIIEVPFTNIKKRKNHDESI